MAVGDTTSSKSGSTYTYSATILRYDGSRWTSMPTTMTTDLLAIWGSAASDIYAVGPATVAHYDGAQWTALTTPSRASFNDIHGLAATDVFAAGSLCVYSGPPNPWDPFSPQQADCTGLVWRYDGSSWKETKLTSAGVTTVDRIWGDSPTEIYALGQYCAPLEARSIRPILGEQRACVSRILRFDGTSGAPVAIDLRDASSDVFTCPALAGIFAASTGDVFVVGAGETIIQRCPGGGC